MVEAKIKWEKNRELTYVGKNGIGYMAGIIIEDGYAKNSIDIYPMTSKGQKASGVVMCIPVDYIDEVIDSLVIVKKLMVNKSKKKNGFPGKRGGKG